MHLHEELLALTAALSEDAIDYALVGGLAVAVWGAPRATQDIDLLVLPQDVERAKACAGRCGFVVPTPPMTFSDGMTLHRVSKVSADQLLMLDLLEVSAHLAPYWQMRERRVLRGCDLWVLSRARADPMLCACVETHAGLCLAYARV
ncbi:MAG: hypothetical protein ACPGUV_01025 [Polyangiales bacterium]